MLGQREDCSAGLEHLCHVYRLHRPDGSPYPVEELPVCQALRKGTVSMRDDIVVHRPDGRRVPLITWAAPLELGASAGHRSTIDAVVWVLEDLDGPASGGGGSPRDGGPAAYRDRIVGRGAAGAGPRGAIIDCNAAARTLAGISGQTVTCEGWLREDGTLLPPEEHPTCRVLSSGIPVRNLVLGLPAGTARKYAGFSSTPCRWLRGGGQRQPASSPLSPTSLTTSELSNSCELPRRSIAVWWIRCL